MKPLSARDPFKIGLVALVAAAIVGGLVLVLSVVSLGTKSYTAELENTGGLRVGEDVEVYGVVSGAVTKIELNGHNVKVTFNLDNDIDLGSKTQAQVKVATLLGTHYLEVTPEGSGRLSGDNIPEAQTDVPYNLQDVINEGADRLEALDPVKLAKMLSTLSDTFEASGDDLGPALMGVGQLSKVVLERQDQTADLLKAAREVADQLSGNTTNIVELMKQTNLVVREITQRKQALHQLLIETSGISEALQSIVTQTDDDLGPVLRNMNAALGSLNDQSESLKSALKLMAPAFRYLANATGSGPWIDLYAKPPAIPTDDMLCKVGKCS